MSTRSAVATLVALAAAVSLAGCMAFRDPDVPADWLRAARTQGRDADGYGAWVVLLVGAERWRARELAGELIACSRDSVWVLPPGGLAAVPARRVRQVKVYTGLSPDGEVESETVRFAHPWDLLEWARYPQGIPAGLDRALIRPRPEPGR